MSLRTRTAARPRRAGKPRHEGALARLFVLHPPEVAGVFELGAGAVIGRSPDGGGPRIPHDTVSRNHLRIEGDASAGHTAADLGSHNGSYLDGADLGPAPAPLASGAVLRLGDVLCVYELERPAPPAPEVALPGQAGATARLRQRLAQVATGPAPALLVGETGTGKEHLAAELHRLSGRSGPLCAVNCATLGRDLIESQLFGHVRGAFTGATAAHLGFFRSADQGTLLLDEVGELPLELQPKLLRVLQDGEVVPVGSTERCQTDVRVIAASNRDLEAMCERGEFRRDLLARLAMGQIAVPPLRDRRADLPAWLAVLDQRLRARTGAGGRLLLDPDALEAVLLEDWPDNLRGLDRLVHDLAPHAGLAGFADLPEWLHARAEPPADDDPLTPAASPRAATPTREELAAALATADGRIADVARQFGRDRKQIYRWLERYGLRGRA